MLFQMYVAQISGTQLQGTFLSGIDMLSNRHAQFLVEIENWDGLEGFAFIFVF